MESNPVEQELAPEIEDIVEERISVASQRQLIWWRFRKHRVAVVATAIIVIFYSIVIFADFLATNVPADSEAFRGLMPPQPVHIFDGWKPSPHVCAVSGARNPITDSKGLYTAWLDKVARPGAG